MTRRRDAALRLAGRLALTGLVIAVTILASADLFNLLSAEPYLLVGAYLVARRPRNAIGWLLLGYALAFIATTPRLFADTGALMRGDPSLTDRLVVWISVWGGWASYLLFLALTIVFPSGRLPVGRGRGAAIVLLAAGVAAVVLSALTPTIKFSTNGGLAAIRYANPVAVLPDLPLWTILPIEDAVGLLMIALVAIGVVRMVLRYRAASGIEGLQLRWLVAAVTFVFLGLVLGLGSLVIFGDTIGVAAWLGVLVAYPTIPLAIGIAVMRYRLFEIDRIISRTISWALVTGLLLAVFAGLVVALQEILATFTQGETLAVAASTLVAATLFQPVRRRVQASVDRRFDRKRYDGQRTVEGFAARVRIDADLVRLRWALLATTGETVRPSSAAVWLRGGPEERR